MKTRLMILVGMLCVGVLAKAQEEEKTFTNEDLTKFATVMLWANMETDRMGKEVGEWVGESEVLSGSKYMEFSKADKKGAIAEVEASEEELAAYQEILKRTEDAKAMFKETYVGKIKEEIGAGLYNDLRAALKTDDELKDRYDTIFAALAEAATTAAEESDS